MKVAALLMLLALQSTPAPSGDLTIAMREGTATYCQGQNASGARGTTADPKDILLYLPIKTRYVNNRSETILLPQQVNWTMRMRAVGQPDFIVLRRGGGGSQGLDEKALTQAQRPTEGFLVLAGRNNSAPEGMKLSVLKYKDDAEETYDYAHVPVVDRGSGVDIRGKTIEIVTTRELRVGVSPTLVSQLKAKWREYGIVWEGVIESEKLTFRIPEEPLTRDCRAVPPSMK